MKKILFFSFVVIFFFFFAVKSNAQMMGYPVGSSGQTTDSDTKDEATGKAVWDKLQNNQVTCSQLSEDDFDKLGDFFMGNMMGSSHDSMDQLMIDRLGQQGEQQMHIAMGKRLSGCFTNASLPQGSNYFMPMMGGWNWNNQSQGGAVLPMMGYGNNGFNGRSGLLSLICIFTWIVLMVYLILGAVYYWKEIKKHGK